MIEIIIAILLASVKYALTFPLAVYEFKFTFFETVLWLNVGGILGVYFFAYLWDWAIRLWEKYFGNRLRSLKSAYKSKKDKKVYTIRNRRIIRIKQRYGLKGIVITTPILLSIPIGVFLLVRYYRQNKFKFLYLIASNIIWSIIYTAFYMFWVGVFSK
jgi:hypothetical protein